jgi:hypothetical protein
MQDATEEIARRVLQNVLRQLDGGDRASAAPVIVIVLGDAAAARAESGAVANAVAPLPAVVKQSACGCQNNSHISGANSLQSSHPGLERFDLPEDNAVSNAPRMCLMEPDRACVGSGACEMRGY